MSSALRNPLRLRPPHGERLVKVLRGYDNTRSFSCRVVDLVGRLQ